VKGFKKVLAVTIATAGVFSVAHADDDGRWEVRLRAVRLDPANKSDAYAPLGIPADAIHVNGKWLPDLDIERFFTPHWSSELLLTYPQSQTVTVEKSALGGPTAIGTFKHLPPTLTLKYNFLPNQVFQPYIGAGVNVTLLMKDNLTVPTVGHLDLETWSVGPAVQAGFDYRLAPHWYLSADLKWAMIRSDVKFQGSKISEARIDPLLFGVGVGYRF
jgi:outer membrane protein